MLPRKSSILRLFSLLLIALASANSVHGANILGVFTSHSPSHLIVHMSSMRALAERGHNVTVFCSMEPKIKHKNIKTYIIPLSTAEQQEFDDMMSSMAKQENTILSTLGSMFGKFSILIEKQFDVIKNPKFTWIYDNVDTKFDLLFLGAFINSYQIGIAAKLKIPIIIEWSSQPMEFTDDLLGNPREISYVPNMNISLKPGQTMTFLQRLQNFFMHYFMTGFRIFIDRMMSNYYNQLWGNDKRMPDYYEAKKNVSIIFCNSHSHSEGPIKPFVPGVVEIGGIQIKNKPDALPQDIAAFLDTAKDGAILFSLGSNLKGEYIKPEIVQTIFKTLSKLKQKIIWKWEDEQKTPGNSANILYKKWLPQDDILAHPNIKLFITHAGKGGVAEAQYHAVPMLALPVFADQPTNAEKLVDAGYGLRLNLLTLEATALQAALKELLENPKYTTNIKQFADLYRDRPLTAQENVVFWTEYVIRHHGAAHLQSPLVHMSTIASLNLDIYALLAVVLIIFFLITKLVFKLIIKLFRKSKSKKKFKKQ